MDNRTRNLLIGLGTAVAVGAAAYFVSSDAAQDKVESVVNRQKAKHYVKDTLKGNKKAMAVVDKLSDEEISDLLDTVSKVGDLESKLSEYSNQLKDLSSDIKGMFVGKTRTLKDKIMG